VLLVLTSPIWK